MIAVCPNPYRDTGLKYTREAVSLLERAGHKTAVCPIFAQPGDSALPEDVPVAALEEVAGQCSLIIVIGGDGTILAAVRALRYAPIPILGVNLGTMGFLTSIEPDELELIVSAADGGTEVSRRMTLDVALVRGGETVCRDTALNDAVLHGCGDCINLTTWCDDDRINSFSGDGIVVATPTGSTGYSLSTGGPIVEPDTENIIISPICAHVMGPRSFVLDSARTVRVTAERLHDRRAYLSVDGSSVFELANGDTLVVKKSEHRVLMAKLGRMNFFETAYEKLT